ncbi:MAG: pyrroloquinoline quinone biosynthesis protein PqqB [Caldilineae bacterium]|nr:MAG: pyrroloquinoline quinone biosynthesis protein PqqB [Caldilineae bacterium]
MKEGRKRETSYLDKRFSMIAHVEAILLGAAQDGGVPQAGCSCPRCQAAQADPRRSRWVVSLGLVDRTAGQSWIVDATPDFRQQWGLLHRMAPDCSLAGILLTHAHLGHYTGLLHLGKEAWNTHQLPVYASPSMCRFLQGNAPWRQLVEHGNILLHPLAAEQTYPLSKDLRVTPMPVPHRSEWSDVWAYVVAGPTGRLFFCPDIDDWELWPYDLGHFLRAMDAALLDGCFFDGAELPGRDMTQIPHPLAVDTARRVAVARDAGLLCDVRLVHLNHTNPLWDPGPERAWLREQGLDIAERGDRWQL